MHMWHSIWLQRQSQKKLQSTVNLLVALRVDVGLFNVFREAVTTQIASRRALAVGPHFSWAAAAFFLRLTGN